MQITFDDDIKTTLLGTDFDDTVFHSGGNIGLVNWGEEVTYDNFVLTAIPEPSSIFFAPFCLAWMALRRRR